MCIDGGLPYQVVCFSLFVRACRSHADELTFAPLELRCPGAPGYRGTLCHPRGKGLASLRRSSVLLQVACDRSPAGHPPQSVSWVRRTRRLIPYRSDPSQMSPARYPTRQLPHHNPLKTWVHWCGRTFQISYVPDTGEDLTGIALKHKFNKLVSIPNATPRLHVRLLATHEHYPRPRPMHCSRRQGHCPLI